MNWLDIVIAVPVLWGLCRGFREGIVTQLGGLAGLVLGVYLAWRFGRQFGLWLHFDASLAGVLGFVIILLGVLLALALVGRLASGIFRVAGLGILDQVGGLLLGGIKMVLILSLLLYGFDFLNRKEDWVKGQTLSGSVLYEPVKGISNHVFPWVDFARKKLLGDTPPPQETRPIR